MSIIKTDLLQKSAKTDIYLLKIYKILIKF